MYHLIYLIYILLFVLLVSTTAFVPSSTLSTGFKALNMAEDDATSPGKPSLMDILSGKAAVQASKRSDPGLYRTNLGKRIDRKGAKTPKMSPAGQACVDAFMSAFPANARPGTSFDMDAKEASFRFSTLADCIGEANAVQAVANSPLVMTVSDARVRDNWKVYEQKWGFDKAAATIVRNPNILQVPTRGYGSAETSEDETIYISYLVAATRPAGKPLLLTLLALLLYKPLVSLGILPLL
jgi:hypothetical protein